MRDDPPAVAGLRQRKKQRTREAIIDAALELFDLIGDVGVERHGLDPELDAELAHGQRLDPVASASAIAAATTRSRVSLVRGSAFGWTTELSFTFVAAREYARTLHHTVTM